jgi:hypothetical protein
MAPPAGFLSCLTGFGVCWLARDFGLELGQQVGVRAICVQLGGWVERIQPHNVTLLSPLQIHGRTLQEVGSWWRCLSLTWSVEEGHRSPGGEGCCDGG